ncbi:hypothetical protein JCM19240_3852 [Vibrio maritimus]|uniref:Uncharacterized protein n=1 Tax=Vibrio maritimus TaxID=990268 RepID=A0A090TAD4_9VIBR|nr:hypothetical protein JCM19240_3852 [Vibrio maritimus]
MLSNVIEFEKSSEIAWIPRCSQVQLILYQVATSFMLQLTIS